jgi:hypothetical protein
MEHHSDFTLPSESDTQRASFLLEMYKQTWANINRHILVVWQAITVLVGTLAAFSLVEKGEFSASVYERVLSAKLRNLGRRLLFIGRFDPEEQLVPFVMFT